MKEWKLEDQIKTKDDLVHYMFAVLDEWKASFYTHSFDTPDKAFEYFIIACKDIINISKQKGWID